MPPLTIVITRPQEDAVELAAALHAQGFDTFTEPLLAIETCAQNKPALEAALAHAPQALLATSRHAVTAFAGMSDIRHIPLFAVGEATAAHAAALGFTHIQSASGNALALAAYVQTHCDPAQGPLLYLQGNDISHDIITPLSQAGFAAQAVTLYRANTATALSPQLCKAIADRNIAAIMFFSARTASVYAKLALRHCLHDAHTGMTALCLSGNIASKLHALPWKNIRIADCPDTLHMLEITGKLFSADASGT